MSTYKPNTIDTDSIPLPEDLLPLAESIAKNVHEVWAKNRLQEGWTYGECRDDIKKTHPCLIPYEELTEVEKDYDRRTSQETIKTIISMGYKITK